MGNELNTDYYNVKQNWQNEIQDLVLESDMGEFL